jgi:hypothetical protein
MSDAEKISKIDAAHRQLRQAIILFFEDQDMVSVHTLATASQQVLIDLGAKAGVVSMVKNRDLIRPDKQKFVGNLLNLPENFFKHADRDPDAVLEFYPASTPFYIIDAAVMYRMIAGQATPAVKSYEVWFALNYPDVLVDGAYKDNVLTLIKDDPTLADKKIARALLKGLEGQ